jgi:Electron transfer DM13
MPSPSRRTVVTATVALAIVVAAVALPLFQPWRLVTDTVTNTVVDEALPDAGPVSIFHILTGGTDNFRRPLPRHLRGDHSAAESRPAGPERLSLGSFITHEHETTGTAAVVRLADGSRILRLEGLDTSDGPDLDVWLSDAPLLEGRAGWHVFDDGLYHSPPGVVADRADLHRDCRRCPWAS